MKSEYLSLSDATREAITRQQLCDDLRIIVNKPMLHSDNQTALSIDQNPVQYQCSSKHFVIRYHFIPPAVQNDLIKSHSMMFPLMKSSMSLITEALEPHKHTSSGLRLA
jgi:hypothetical protein